MHMQQKKKIHRNLQNQRFHFFFLHWCRMCSVGLIQNLFVFEIKNIQTGVSFF